MDPLLRPKLLKLLPFAIYSLFLSTLLLVLLKSLSTRPNGSTNSNTGTISSSSSSSSAGAGQKRYVFAKLRTRLFAPWFRRPPHVFRLSKLKKGKKGGEKEGEGAGAEQMASGVVNSDRLSVQLESLISQRQGRDGFLTPGALWLDTEGNLIQAHGGCVIFHEESKTFFWYGENKNGETYMPPGSSLQLQRVDFIGISCYSSTDLVHWRYQGLALAADDREEGSDLHFSKVAERPKVLFNDRTKQFVMWLHLDNADYSLAAVGIATSSSPTGPFMFVNRLRPHGFDSRDLTLFKDDDGTGYLFYSSEMNTVMHIGRLSRDYLNLDGPSVRRMVKESREAPAVFKYNKRYYMLSSGCTGWSPNEARIHSADKIMGKWREEGDPCVGGEEAFRKRTFDSQSTFVLPIPGLNDSFLYMGDRWMANDLRFSTYVWLPMKLRPQSEGKNETTFVIEWHHKWKIQPTEEFHWQAFEDQ